MPRRSALLLMLATTACGSGQISYSYLESGSYVLEEDATVTLEVDVDAMTYSLAAEGGDSVSGTLAALDEEEWTQCCFLNGSSHSRFETFSLSEAPLDLGPLSLEAPHLSADGPMIFDAATADDMANVSGHSFVQDQ